MLVAFFVVFLSLYTYCMKTELKVNWSVECLKLKLKTSGILGTPNSMHLFVRA
jgi:hypothetical protein